MKQSQVKTMLITSMIFLAIMAVGYAVTTRLLSPVAGFIDDDGFLDLRGSCEPTSENVYDGTTSYNITEATLYTNVDGTWKSNATITAIIPTVNSTYYFNFTNHINQSAEGTFQWDIRCTEENISKVSSTQTSFEGNRTITVEYTRPTVTALLPVDGVYDLTGRNMELNCTASPSSGWSIGSVALYATDSSGVWTLNTTRDTSALLAGAEAAVGWDFDGTSSSGVADGTDLIWGCAFTQNTSIGGYTITGVTQFSTNRTINVELPATITLNKPANNNWSKYRLTTVNFSVSSAYIPSITPAQSCQLWTNDSGTWASKSGTIYMNNDTSNEQGYNFLEKTGIKWGWRCQDANDGNVFTFSSNRTLNIDQTDPVISIATENLTFFTSTPDITLTVTDINLEAIRLFNNFSGTYKLNVTNNTLVSGVEVTLNLEALSDGYYVYNFTVNDTSGREVVSDTLFLTIDSIPPTFSNLFNLSVDSKCDQRIINWTTNELSNYTFYIDTDVIVSDGTITTSNAKTLSHSVVVDFNLNAEVTHYINITACDRAGNCNATGGQYTFDTPARVCAGWSQYGVYDSRINLSKVQNQSGADLVYLWDALTQEWIFYTAGLTSNGGVDVGFNTKYHVVHLFENTNSTWFRNQTNLGAYNYNLTSTSNFINVPKLYNFGNLTESFMNSTRDFPTSVGLDLFNNSFFAGYNNSAQDYVNHIYNFTWSNATFLQPCNGRTENPTCMESVWVATDFNATWDGTQMVSSW